MENLLATYWLLFGANDTLGMPLSAEMHPEGLQLTATGK